VSLDKEGNLLCSHLLGKQHQSQRLKETEPSVEKAGFMLETALKPLELIMQRRMQKLLDIMDNSGDNSDQTTKCVLSEASSTWLQQRTLKVHYSFPQQTFFLFWLKKNLPFDLIKFNTYITLKVVESVTKTSTDSFWMTFVLCLLHICYKNGSES